MTNQEKMQKEKLEELMKKEVELLQKEALLVNLRKKVQELSNTSASWTAGNVSNVNISATTIMTQKNVTYNVPEVFYEIIF